MLTTDQRPFTRIFEEYKTVWIPNMNEDTEELDEEAKIERLYYMNIETLARELSTLNLPFDRTELKM